jgi:hypothetical protein
MKGRPVAPSQSYVAPESLKQALSQLQPDTLLPSQVRPRHNTLQRSEWLLLWALLADALHVLASFHPGRPGRSSKEKRQWEADLAWVREESTKPFSFAYVCDHLGLDREAVRSHVERLITNA